MPKAAHFYSRDLFRGSQLHLGVRYCYRSGSPSSFHGDPPSLRAQKFPKPKSFNMRLSKLRFAISRFSFAFSCSNSFSCCLVHLQTAVLLTPAEIRRSTISVSFDTCGIDFP